MAFLLRRLSTDAARPPFSCGNNDLDDYYHRDSVAYGKELLAVTYNVHSENNEPDDKNTSPIAFFSVSNDSIKKQNRSQHRQATEDMPEEKRKLSSMPAVKIGRLGVSEDLRSGGIGTEIIDFIKVWFTKQNKTGCRFILVDAYNVQRVLSFYQKNGFFFLSEKDVDKDTRLMYFDLITFRP